MTVSAQIQAFLEHHKSMGSSPKTIEHYSDSLNLFQRCLDESAIDDSFTNQAMNTFAGWLRETPSRAWRGKTERSIYGVHGALKDVKEWCRWLESEKYIFRAPEVPVPRLPPRLFPIFSEDDLELAPIGQQPDGDRQARDVRSYEKICKLFV